MAVEAAAMVAAAKEEEEGKSPHPMRYIQCVDAGKKVRKHSKRPKARPKTKHAPKHGPKHFLRAHQVQLVACRLERANPT